MTVGVVLIAVAGATSVCEPAPQNITTDVDPVSDRRTPLSLAFFAAIGLGFLTLEIALIQRFVLFLGFPTYALSVVLFSLLLWTGAGALLAGRIADGRRGLAVALVFACALIAASAFGLQPLLGALIDLPFAARVAITIVLLAPLGIALGDAHAAGAGPPRRAASRGRGVGLGCERHRVGGGLGRRDHRCDRGRVSRRHAGGRGLLPDGAGSYAGRGVAGSLVRALRHETERTAERV